MNIQDFYDLDEMEQVELIWKLEPIAKKEIPGYLIELFQVDKFYLETKTDIYTKSIEYIKPLPSPWN